MPRKPTILQSEYPYNISARCINRDWFNMPLDLVWEIMSNNLYICRHAFNTEILSFVLMANHFHLLMKTPESNIDSFMAYFMRETSRGITKVAGRINQTYGQRYYKCIVQQPIHFLNCYKYVYYNPVKAGACSRAEEYPYSTLNGLLGLSHLLIPTAEDTLLLEDVDRVTKWLNTSVDEHDWKTIKNALKRKIFQLPKDRRTKRDHHLNFDMI